MFSCPGAPLFRARWRLCVSVVTSLGRAGWVDQALYVTRRRQHVGALAAEQLSGAIARVPWRDVICGTAGDENRNLDLR